MTANILDGSALCEEIKKQLAGKIKNSGLKPGLDVILVGNNPASQSYVNHKNRACTEVGIRSRIHKLPENCSQTDVEKIISECNNDSSVHGILLQLPLPAHLSVDDLLEKISPKKDVDGFHPYNLGRLVQRRPLLRPCTPLGIIKLLETAQIELAGKNAVVVGASNIVGRPMALELLLAKSTVTVCHRFTKNLAQLIDQADILISATGQPGLINSSWIKPGAVVVDVGFSRLDNGKISGDIDFESAKKIASMITPVPGGVGPMTVAMLLHNTVMACEGF